MCQTRTGVDVLWDEFIGGLVTQEDFPRNDLPITNSVYLDDFVCSILRENRDYLSEKCEGKRSVRFCTGEPEIYRFMVSTGLTRKVMRVFRSSKRRGSSTKSSENSGHQVCPGENLEVQNVRMDDRWLPDLMGVKVSELADLRWADLS